MDKGRLRKVLVAFNERHQSLIKDGYRDLYSSASLFNYYVKMSHRNGNIVFLVAYYKTYTITQRTNGKLVHEETITR